LSSRGSRGVLALWQGGQKEGLFGTVSIWKPVVKGGAGGEMSGFGTMDISENSWGEGLN
jgi:hypothetical protein